MGEARHGLEQAGAQSGRRGEGGAKDAREHCLLRRDEAQQLSQGRGAGQDEQVVVGEALRLEVAREGEDFDGERAATKKEEQRDGEEEQPRKRREQRGG